MTCPNLAHRPVMLHEVLDALALAGDACVLDCTFGRGGHSRAVLDSLGPKGRLLALDKDADALASREAGELLADPRFTLVQGSFGQLAAHVKQQGFTGRVSGILMDLGVSSPQLDDPSRGFSFTRNGPLDMRMDTRQGETAAEWLAKVSEGDLAVILRDYGEERFARRIARLVVAERGAKPIETTGQLAALIERAVPGREPGKHPATRSFQAIRIHINRELADLEAGLRQAVDVLAPGGRLVVLAFHSLEDRIVKRYFRDQERGGVSQAPWPLPPTPGAPPTLRRCGKARMPDADEIAVNPRARSAVLRVAERVAG